MKITDTHVYFTSQSPLGNWSFSKFQAWVTHKDRYGTEVEVVYAEQAFMAAKASYFGDDETLKQILNTGVPEKLTQLGRQVKNFNPVVWSQVGLVIMYDILFDKFGQNPDLLKILVDTGDKTLVYATPYDTIWGVGLDQDDPDILNFKKWRGKNLLGLMLMHVRDRLKEPGKLRFYGFDEKDVEVKL